MYKIRLETRDGSFVTDKLVPPFQIMPEVMMWGSRFFALHGQGQHDEYPVYREVCCFAIVDIEGAN